MHWHLHCGALGPGQLHGAIGRGALPEVLVTASAVWDVRFGSILSTGVAFLTLPDGLPQAEVQLLQPRCQSVPCGMPGLCRHRSGQMAAWD